MPITKKYHKSKQVCRVGFKFDGDEAQTANSVCLAGDFNDWDINATPMNRNKTGFECSMDLSSGQQYRFRYVIDGKVWCNDSHADDYEYSGIGESMNSVLLL
ncbi:isoamylase early set domain-containing protein [Desulfomicrobium sp. ZS1]|jgi:1,4-alpha-glucan branching enzyme|uniref:isoamylase early set domain-containing protein n=1 Tax=Desulfomicrobium sp. ZS1 TaxID=2952228 RepID=UPI0020B1D650|nr:isoamylase early set domain-containing protein [Desulfomicrobium sp. ZS1]UTF51712.1 isoamylase early set domain-containing protein [Desulfomicrobium sp. ZS1]